MSKQLVVMKQGQGESLEVLGTRVRFLCTPDKTDHGWSLMEVAIPAHGGPPPHDHPWDEAYYVTHGQVRFSLADREQIVNAGEFLYAPAGTLHGFSGASADPARMLIFDIPAHAEAFFRDVDREVKGPSDMAKIPEIGERNQIHFRAQ